MTTRMRVQMLRSATRATAYNSPNPGASQWGVTYRVQQLGQHQRKERDDDVLWVATNFHHGLSDKGVPVWEGNKHLEETTDDPRTRISERYAAQPHDQQRVIQPGNKDSTTRKTTYHIRATKHGGQRTHAGSDLLGRRSVWRRHGCLSNDIVEGEQQC